MPTITSMNAKEIMPRSAIENGDVVGVAEDQGRGDRPGADEDEEAGAEGLGQPLLRT